MDVRIGSDVHCRDGRAGTVERVVVSPRRREVTHLIVAKGFLLHRDVVVPTERVARVEDGRVELDLTTAELNRLPEYRELDYVAPDPTWRPVHPYEPANTLLALDVFGAAVAGDQPALVGRVLRHERTGVPEDAAILRRGTPVECRDGRVGTVDRVLLDPGRRYVTHFAVRRGLLLGRDVVVPIDWVTRIDDTGVFVDVGRDQLERLPEYLPRRSDAELAKAARDALSADVRTQTSEITVRAEQGTVELTGRATDRDARLAASEVVRGIPGVLTTRNLLAVGSEPSLDSATGLDYVWLEQFLRTTTGLRVDEAQAREIVAQAERKLGDLFDVAEDTALANGRQIVLWHDLPLTKGLRATIREYERFSRELAATAIEVYLRDSGVRSQLDELVRAALPRLFGALLLLAGRVIASLTPSGISASERLAWLTRTAADRPTPGEVERAARIIDLML